MNFCPYCGEKIEPKQEVCLKCGRVLKKTTFELPKEGEGKSKVLAVLLALFFGGLGIHNFYLGYNTKGVLQIIATFLLLGLGVWWGILDAILLLIGNINSDANGNPLV